MDAYHLSFENTENAFAYKSDKELRKARFLFSSMSYKTLVKVGTRLTPFIMKLRLPVKGLIKKTIFAQFVGGESLEETAVVVDKLEKFDVNVILDYGVEGKEGEENFEHSCEEFIRVVKYASGQPNIPFISIKVTGFARFALLEKLDAAANGRSGYTGHVHNRNTKRRRKSRVEQGSAKNGKDHQRGIGWKRRCAGRCRGNLDTGSGRRGYHADDGKIQ
jgi:proline dehydrogenase